jgi:hypothetical protein
MRIFMLNTLALWVAGAALAAALPLPAPEELMTMTLADRLALYRSIATLPPDERETQMQALRNEINGMTLAQKQLMQDRFQSEFASLPTAQQDQVKSELQAMGR